MRLLFFKQKTACEMRISDWSSDVCSSVLAPRCPARRPRPRADGAYARRGRGAGRRRADDDRRPRILWPLLRLHRRRDRRVGPPRPLRETPPPRPRGERPRSAHGRGHDRTALKDIHAEGAEILFARRRGDAERLHLPRSGLPFAASRKKRVAPRIRSLSAHTVRSEEHTSELQSLMRISYAVFCLKKKNKNNIRQNKI